jgi:hypothetical protein
LLKAFCCDSLKASEQEYYAELMEDTGLTEEARYELNRSQLEAKGIPTRPYREVKTSS